MGGGEICLGETFLLGGGNITKSEFDHSNLFRSQKQHSVNIKHWLQSKLACPVYTKSMKENKNGTGAMTTTEYDVFIWL